MILVDTDVMIDLLRGYPLTVAWLSSIGEEEIVLSGFVVMVLLQGCRNKKEQTAVEKILRPFGVTWPVADACSEALSIFARCHLDHEIGILDALIGQMAAALNTPLCTFNQKHYRVVPELKLLQPYSRGS